MTPPRLVQIGCPACQGTQWIIDSDYRGIHGQPHVYEDDHHTCRHCGASASGWRVVDKGPSEFFLQPHELYPMSQEEFDKWVAILREHFPDHHLLARLGKDWYPRLPQDAPNRIRPAPPEPPVVALRDQSSSKALHPSLDDAMEWLGMMKPGEHILLEHRDGGKLRVEAPSSGTHAIRCDDAQGRPLASGGGHDLPATLAILERYLADDVEESLARIRGERAGQGVPGPIRRFLVRKLGKRS